MTSISWSESQNLDQLSLLQLRLQEAPQRLRQFGSTNLQIQPKPNDVELVQPRRVNFRPQFDNGNVNQQIGAILDQK